MVLYSDTQEHADAVLSEKESYLNLPPPLRCIRLAEVCNKAFDYCKTITFEQLDKNNDSVWVAYLWQGVHAKCHIADLLVAVDLCPPKCTTITSSSLEVHNQELGVPTTVCLSQFDGPSVSVPYNGVPVVALQYADVVVRVICKDGPPGTLSVRYRVLPTQTRQYMGTKTHSLVIHAPPLEGGKVLISGGKMIPFSEKEYSCNVM